MSIIVLPPGSTGADLQNAIDNADFGGTIEISSNITLTGSVAIPTNSSLTIQSSTGNNWVLAQAISNTRHFMAGGNLTLQNITLDGGAISGGVQMNGGNLTIDAGTIIRHCFATNGGGVSINTGGSFTMLGGEINGNISNTDGGGVFLHVGSNFTMLGGKISENQAVGGGGILVNWESIFTMNDGEISGNEADTGGGVFITGNSTIIMHGGEISNNKAGAHIGGGVSGGVLVVGGSTFIMDGGKINNNMASNGGGIYAWSVVDISGNAEIVNNTATNNSHGLGGGIFTNNFNLLTVTGPLVRFANNKADFATNRESANDAVYATHILNMESNWTVPFQQGYNNFDINQLGPRVYIVAYEANGGVGNHIDIVQDGTEYTILTPEAASISRVDYTFIGWNTQQDGSGTSYMPEEIIIITGNLTLYAQWEAAREEINCCLIILLFLVMKCRPKKKCCCKNC